MSSKSLVTFFESRNQRLYLEYAFRRSQQGNSSSRKKNPTQTQTHTHTQHTHMAPTNDRVVWNETLCKALRARADQKRQQGSRNYIGFQQAAHKIGTVRKDIYAFKNGRVVNLPKTGLNNTMYELCRRIIAGTEPALPPGYVPTLVEDRNGNTNETNTSNRSTNAFENHPYLTKIKIRGGAFAILMAFHLSQTTTMTKAQIIAAGQRFCDEQMEADFHQGRMHGAWKAVDTLKRHLLIHVNSTVQYREGRGMRAAGEFTYQLTRDGEAFTKSLLDRHAAVRSEVSALLRAWVETAAIGNQKVFRLGTSRRRVLHDACDALNVELKKVGGYLKHESTNEAERTRVLHVTLLPLNSDSTPQLNTESLFREEDSDSSLSYTSWKAAKNGVKPPPLRNLVGSASHLLSGEGSPPKRARHWPPPNVAAAEAAMRRLAEQQIPRAKSTTNSAPVPRSLLERSTEDTKLPARTAADVVEIVDSEGEEDMATFIVPSQLLKRPPPMASVQSSKADAVVDLTESQDQADAFGPVEGTNGSLEEKSVLVIYIDNRERNRNTTPRYLRTELERLVSRGCVATMPNAFLSKVTVVEKSLEAGDFAFSLDGNNLISPLVERKTIADLVQRSYRKDHWFQLQRMRDSVSSKDGVCFFLLEGDFRSAVRYPTGAAQQLEDYGTDCHTIDNEESLIRFLGRAVLSTKKVRFIQTKELQGSLRAIAAIGLVVASRPCTPHHLSIASSSSDRKELANFLKSAGMPWQIASCVADGIGSKKELERLYGSIEDEICRSHVLAPLVSPCTEKGGLKGSAVGWSRAIYKACYSVLSDVALAKDRFESLSSLVDDHATLLECLHTFLSSEEALDRVYESPQEIRNMMDRVVTTRSSVVLQEWIPKDDRTDSVFSFETHRSSEAIPSVTMQTHAGPYRSNKLAIFVLEGSELVGRLRLSITSNQDVSAGAREVSASIRSDCCSSQEFDQAADSCILIIRGLGPATDQWAKIVGYRSEYRFGVEMVLADLSISLDTVVLQALRLREDLEIMLQELSLSCFNYQLLTRT
jgi:ERCC4-type nuclease